MKHKFLQPNALLNELRQIYISNGKLIIAYDFDNTIHPSGKISAEEGEEVIPVVCCVCCLLENPIVNAGRAECGCARGVHFKCD